MPCLLPSAPKEKETEVYTYNEKDQVLTFGEGDQATSITLPKDKYEALRDLPEGELLKVAKVIGRVMRKAESEQKAKARQEFFNELTKRAGELRERYLEWLDTFNAETGYLREKYGIDAVKPFSAGDVETVRFYTTAGKLNLAKLAAEYPEIKIRVESQNVEGLFDDPKLAQLATGARELNLQLAALASSLDAELGTNFETIAVVFGENGEIVDKSKTPRETQGARGGSAPGRAVATGYRIGDKVFNNAQQVCEFLGIVPKSHAPDGTPYWASAIRRQVDSGQVVPIYK
jgi:hypothetical protein